MPSDQAAEATQRIFAHASHELALCAPGQERALLLSLGLELLEAYRYTHTRAPWGQHKAAGGRDVPRAEPGQSGVVHAAPLRSTSAPVDMMDRVLLRMTRASATVFFLFELEGLGLSEASRVMAVDEESAHVMLLEARKEFRAIAAELSQTLRHE